MQIKFKDLQTILICFVICKTYRYCHKLIKIYLWKYMAWSTQELPNPHWLKLLMETFVHASIVKKKLMNDLHWYSEYTWHSNDNDNRYHQGIKKREEFKINTEALYTLTIQVLVHDLMHSIIHKHIIFINIKIQLNNSDFLKE